jgi:hypothetical protein
MRVDCNDVCEVMNVLTIYSFIDDVELIYWAAGLMHEFVLKGNFYLIDRWH